MSLILSGTAGSNQHISSGLAVGAPVFLTDPVPTNPEALPSRIGGKFRRAVYDVTVDGTSTPLASCVVIIFRTSDDVKIDKQTSSSVGKYEVSVYDDGPFYVVSYKAGSPDVAGTTVNTIVGV